MMPMNRLPRQKYPEPRRSAVRSLLAETVGQARPRPSRRSFFTRPAVVAVGAVALVGTGAAAAYSQLGPTAPVSDKSSARCYSVASYVPGGDFPGTTIAQPNSSTRAGEVSNAVDACAALWRAGILQPGARTAIVHPGKKTYAVPPLVGCVLPDGRAAVFPGSADSCSKLGLPEAAGPTSAKP